VIYAARVFGVGGVISYRALFNWQSPTFYIPTMFGHPLFQILFFAYLGRFSHVQNDAFFVVGNAVQVCAMAGVYGMAMTVGGERWTATLSPLLATPANRLALFLGRALPQIANGFVVSAFGFACGWALLDFHPKPSSLPALTLVVAITCTSCTGFGLVVGALGLRYRDVFTISNPAYFLMLLVCGVNVPLSALPGWLAAIGRSLPLTHGIEAARKLAAGASFADVRGLVATEIGIGLAWAFLAYVLLRFFEEESRRRATLELL
jgi:ABC-2 type transport system permease protein